MKYINTTLNPSGADAFYKALIAQVESHTLYNTPIVDPNEIPPYLKTLGFTRNPYIPNTRRKEEIIIVDSIFTVYDPCIVFVPRDIRDVYTNQFYPHNDYFKQYTPSLPISYNDARLELFKDIYQSKEFQWKGYIKHSMGIRRKK